MHFKASSLIKAMFLVRDPSISFEAYPVNEAFFGALPARKDAQLPEAVRLARGPSAAAPVEHSDYHKHRSHGQNYGPLSCP